MKNLLRGIVGTTVVLAAAVAFFVSRGGSNSPTKPESAPPVVQIEFCRIIDVADAAYEPQSAAWYAEKNAVLQDRLTKAMAQMRDDRDAGVYNLLKEHGLLAADWRVEVESVRTYEKANGRNNDRVVDLTMTARCQTKTSINVEAVITPALEESLSHVQKHSALTISGVFIPHDAAANTPARSLDWDGFEHSAMQKPTYKLDLQALRVLD